MRSTLMGLMALVAVPAVAVASEIPLAEGVGEGEHARMNMRFEVTFMKIDVAEVDAWLSPETATAVGEILSGEADDDDARDRITEVVLGADSMLLTMEYVRDSGHDRLLRGMRSAFQASMESEHITEEEMERTYEALAGEFDDLAERGVRKGDRLAYRLDGETLRVVYADLVGEPLVAATYTGPEWANGVKGAFFGEESRFRKKLVRSLVEQGD